MAFTPGCVKTWTYYAASSVCYSDVKNTGIIGNCGMIDLCGWQREEMTFEAVNLDETLGDY
jgi:hypothetical protein